MPLWYKSGMRNGKRKGLIIIHSLCFYVPLVGGAARVMLTRTISEDICWPQPLLKTRKSYSRAVYILCALYSIDFIDSWIPFSVLSKLQTTRITLLLWFVIHVFFGHLVMNRVSPENRYHSSFDIIAIVLLTGFRCYCGSSAAENRRGKSSIPTPNTGEHPQSEKHS